MLIVRIPALLALAAMLALLDGPAVAASAYRVVDASGRELGLLADVQNGRGRVILEAGGQMAAVEVRRDQFVSSGVLAYTEADCAGPPLIVNFIEILDPLQISLMRPTAVVGGAVLISTTDTPTPTAVKSLQFLVPEAPPCIPADDTVPAYPTTPLLQVGQFQAPFRIDVASREPAGRHEPRALVVRESSGSLLGPVVGGDLPFQAAVLRPTSQAVLPVVVVRSRMVESVTAVVFGSVDCTGPPFLRLDDDSVAPLFAIGGVTATGDLLLAEGARAFKLVQSQFVPFFEPCSSFPPENVPVQPGVPLLEAASLSPPFRVSLEPVSGVLAGRSGVGSLILVDGAGQVVGPAFARPSQQVQVLLRAGRGVAEVFVSGDVIAGTGQAHFELAGCEGPPLLALGGVVEPAPLVPQTVAGPGGTLHAADGSVAVIALTSRWDVATATCVEDPLAPTPAQGTTVFMDATRFRPPFEVRPAPIAP